MTRGKRLDWLQRGLLALPFLIGIAVLQGLTVEIDTFHGSDARVYQLPTILQLSERLDFSDYPSAQTPLYHVLTAWWGERRRLRALEAAPAERVLLVRDGACAAAAPAPRHAARALAGVRADAPVRAVALRARHVLHAAHGQPGDPVRAPRAGAHPRVLARRRARGVRARLRRDRGGAPHPPGVRVARAGRRRLPAAPGPALAVPARGRRGHARALDRPVRAAGARVGRPRAAERRPGLLRPLRRPSGPRPRGAHPAHRRLHGRARRRLRRTRLRAQPGAPAAAAALFPPRARIRGTHRPCRRAAHPAARLRPPSACSCS